MKNKPVKLKKFLKHNAPKPRKTGINSRPCKICGRVGGHIRKYNLHICRQCFRDYATKLGWKKYR